ncbi:helix-turn-helix domain-containing protein [Flavisolibacter ginsenosidimutans]|uniref:AraC family transcriptional regulator n=1 Tax=Flavisolibacter ginsenosidimutans TaxID=661481 RepID=A0A5B8UFT8_9BACT|nr:helix-turn-helix domain-containing protein [Flavisolibacter ginsenosidimutans]QEC55531.1 AraC family transcriptional regulator [Flavisolibacter ginsenosidimutans]
MSANILLVKNMVCHRCLLAVENVLANASVPFQKVTVGEIYLEQPLSDQQYVSLKSGLAAIGLELIDNRTSGLVEKVKQLVIKKARGEVNEKESKLNLSAYLSQNLYHEYTYLSSLFSSVEGRTVENYFIQQRIEKVKELLVYNEMTLAAIAFEMNYSSVAHLSSQFKQITGLTPSHFKKVGSVKRKLIDRL